MCDNHIIYFIIYRLNNLAVLSIERNITKILDFDKFTENVSITHENRRFVLY